jgi:hypothetical protein
MSYGDMTWDGMRYEMTEHDMGLDEMTWDEI